MKLPGARWWLRFSPWGVLGAGMGVAVLAQDLGFLSDLSTLVMNVVAVYVLLHSDGRPK